eukprot:TRINITY_DN10030_c0_g1_i10.p1 TRINITY_DN10030_c0_g1~~TRINITY_DN10030_c0_g1_i10.p1  ORF type:complete len:289 (+),score=56.62 TRINITY_DN10030_c0_g1_i10:107-973(+)
MYPTEQSCKDVFAFDCIPEKEAVIKDLSSSESEVDELKEIIKKENGLEDVEKLVGECSTVLRHAKEKNPLTESRGIMENISKVEFGLDLLRQRLLSCAFYMLTPQEYSSLVEESQVSADPSVEFFGLEWTSVFRRFYKLGVELRLLKTGLQQNRICVERVHTCLSLIHGLTAETQMHGHAVSSGRLSSSNLSLQLKQQTVTQIGRTASFQNKQQTGLAAASTRGSKHKQSKYKGSRTDSALILKADSSSNANQTTEEKKKSSKQMTKSSRRKSSLMDSFSNIFHALKV